MLTPAAAPAAPARFATPAVLFGLPVPAPRLRRAGPLPAIAPLCPTCGLEVGQATLDCGFCG